MTEPFQLVPLDQSGVAPRPVSARLRTQLVYFAASKDDPGVPPLGPDEYWFPREVVEKVLEEGVVYLVSPLDTANMTEVEITEEQEDFLNWLRAKEVQHARLESL